MLPVTIGLGLINFNLLINSILGSLVSEQAPRAIDAAFRIYMLPQGLFSVAIATVLFPALSRLAARGDRDGLRALNATGTRQIFLCSSPPRRSRSCSPSRSPACSTSTASSAPTTPTAWPARSSGSASACRSAA